MVTGLRHGLRLAATAVGLVLAMIGVVAMVTPGPGAPPRAVAPIELAAPEPSDTPAAAPTDREETTASSAATASTAAAREMTGPPDPQVVATSRPEPHPPMPTPTTDPFGRPATPQVPSAPTATGPQDGTERHVAAATPTQRPSRSPPEHEPGPTPSDTETPSDTATPSEPEAASRRDGDGPRRRPPGGDRHPDRVASEQPRDGRAERSPRRPDRGPDTADRGATATRPHAPAQGTRHAD